MLHLTQRDYLLTRWSGGSSTQLAISPPNAAYTARDFLWRVSSAAVEDERSTFTPLPDYDRWLLLLEGSLVLTHDGGDPVRLPPFQAHAFDGGAATEAVGLCRDFNLMLRKGKCRGALRPVRFSEAGEETLCLRADAARRAVLLYCAGGSGTAEWTGESCVLTQGESLFDEDSPAASLRLTAAGAADFVLAEIWY